MVVEVPSNLGYGEAEEALQDATVNKLPYELDVHAI
jgi:hypothetical protein